MNSTVLELPGTVQVTREFRQFVCVEGHRLETKQHSELDKRIQLHARGHKHGEFALPTDECIVCCSKWRQLVSYISYLLMLAFQPQVNRTYVTPSQSAHLIRVSKVA